MLIDPSPSSKAGLRAGYGQDTGLSKHEKWLCPHEPWELRANRQSHGFEHRYPALRTPII
ncbi:hypothetical protein IBTHAUMO2_760001 [Nitrosopumilaceae archaeon]|nr:hypothetical protein IBTHAUMO2_760001 [Nitrosopumilaceae archaeon]